MSMMSPQETQRTVTQLANDVNDIYEMLSTISMTQPHHGRRLNDLEAAEILRRLPG